jgi:Histidine kinase-, DNA gyrase B-, and HSP90-like ATPase
MTQPYRMTFDIGTIKHLGLQMYSTLPPVIGELVSNAWDAEANIVEITIPTSQLDDRSQIVVSDDGDGMSDNQVRNGYLVVGRDRRKAENRDTTAGDRKLNRPLMGRKGIGKFSGFGIASEVEVESGRGGQVSRFVMNYADLERAAARREIEFPPLPPSGTVNKGTRVTLRGITKFRTRSIDIAALRRGLARRFSVIGEQYDFEVVVNGEPIAIEERDLKRLLEKDAEGKLYLWEYDEVEIVPGSGWKVSGWIGSLRRTDRLEDGIQRGIAILARGKLVQEPFEFDATVGQQFALSYLIGELHAEFVDAAEDTIGTTRNSLVWDTEANARFLEWGKRQVNRIARQWAERRAADNEAALHVNPVYQRFIKEAETVENHRAKKVADKLIRDVIKKDVVAGPEEQEEVVQLCIDFLEFDAFWDLVEDLNGANTDEPARVARLFREWEIVEAKEMMRVTSGRITTIEKLERLIEENALEVPTLHNFLKEFPWVLDPRWNLIADEQTYSRLLRQQFPDEAAPEADRRIDFLCVREGTQLVVVEIKRPISHASVKQLEQIEEYVYFMRDLANRTNDPDLRSKEVVGYLLCGELVDTWQVREKSKTLAASNIYVRRYQDLLMMVQRSHKEFLERYERLRNAKKATAS